jgi:hypothetical protein
MAYGSRAGFRLFRCGKASRGAGRAYVGSVAVVVALLLPAAPSAAATPDDRKDLSGVVTDAGGKPLKDATVIVSTAAVRRGTSPY